MAIESVYPPNHPLQRPGGQRRVIAWWPSHSSVVLLPPPLSGSVRLPWTRTKCLEGVVVLGEGKKTMAIEFNDNDEAYQAWLTAHPQGFVLNTPRIHTPDYMVLHRASCSSISNYTQMARPGGFTERQYIKVCGETVDALRLWVRHHGRPDGSFTGECGRCKPI